MSVMSHQCRFIFLWLKKKKESEVLEQTLKKERGIKMQRNVKYVKVVVSAITSVHPDHT